MAGDGASPKPSPKPEKKDGSSFFLLRGFIDLYPERPSPSSGTKLAFAVVNLSSSPISMSNVPLSTGLSKYSLTISVLKSMRTRRPSARKVLSKSRGPRKSPGASRRQCGSIEWVRYYNRLTRDRVSTSILSGIVVTGLKRQQPREPTT